MTPNRNNSNPKGYLPLFGSAVGMLLGCLVLAAIGAMTGSELATCVLAATGMIGGSIAGGWLGSRRCCSFFWRKPRTNR